MDLHHSFTRLFFALQFLSDPQRPVYEPVQEEAVILGLPSIYRMGQLHLPPPVSGVLELNKGHRCLYIGNLCPDTGVQPPVRTVHHVEEEVSEVFSDGLLFSRRFIVRRGCGDLAPHAGSEGTGQSMGKFPF